MIHVLATIRTTPSRRDDFLKEFHRVMPAVLAEEGCIEYGPAIDIDSGISVQSEVRPDVVMVIEKWETLDHLKAHLSAPHMIEYRGRIQGLVTGVELQILESA